MQSFCIITTTYICDDNDNDNDDDDDDYDEDDDDDGDDDVMMVDNGDW